MKHWKDWKEHSWRNIPGDGYTECFLCGKQAWISNKIVYCVQGDCKDEED